MMDSAVTTHSRGALVGISVCPKCHVINKIRTTDETQDGKYKCHSCGEEIGIEKTIRK